MLLAMKLPFGSMRAMLFQLAAGGWIDPEDEAQVLRSGELGSLDGDKATGDIGAGGQGHRESAVLVLEHEWCAGPDCVVFVFAFGRKAPGV
jgi:hypothetical protein